MTEQKTKLAIGLMVLTTFVFASQDAISRHLATHYNVTFIVMVRYWFFSVFAIAMATRSKGGIRAIAKSHYPKIQIFRGALLALQINIMLLGFVYLGLVQAHAVFACYPLLIAAFSGVILGEHVGWRRWCAIGVGFIGILIILKPGGGMFSPYALITLCAAFMFALYGLLTRYVGRKDGAMTSFFWTGVSGAVITTTVGIWSWDTMTWADSGWMLALSMTGVFGHFMLIKVYELAEASAVQPFAYFQLVFASTMGVVIFGEDLHSNIMIGAALIVSAGLFTFWRERIKK